MRNTLSGRFPLGRSDRWSPRRSARRVAVLVALFLAASCTVAGSAVIAPYRSRPVNSLIAKPVVSRSANVLALAPDGAVVAVTDPVHGVCLRSVYTGAAAVCAGLTLTGTPTISAAFSPDGQTVALGRDVSALGHGAVWLIDAKTGKAEAVPLVAGPPSRSSGGSWYVGMLWNSVDGHLLLVSNSKRTDGERTVIVDLDPGSLIPRVVAEATSPFEFQSGDMAGGGSKMIFTVYRADQIPPNPVVIDLESGARKEFGPLGPNGSRLVPLAVSPDGKQAVVGSATYGHPGPPRLLDVASGRLTDIPGLTGDFVMACYSPNGSQIAVVSTISATTARIAVAAIGGGSARTLSDVPGGFPDGSRLTWSRVDVLSVESPKAATAGSVVGWALSN